MAARTTISWPGIGLRFLSALLLVFLTYNPSEFSYYHWGIIQLIDDFSIAKVFIGIVLIIGWAIFLRATSRSLGKMGLILTTGFFVTLVLLLQQLGFKVTSLEGIVYVVLVVLAAIMTVGMSWSHIRRRLTGQVDVDEMHSDDH
ncbi:hypothetical protein MNBD_GAMMA12-437 [hydrothermal vent metagenome]|uniref:Uncharacterized protein n=1 Tax=hydrothermal vent metagenome TaxID=652676 RepID=A0A3B0YEA5_9ZZZZ